MTRLFGAVTLTASLLCGTALAGSCTLANGIQHVVYLQFDNTHFMRDNPNVPSDLEQMPHLLNFIKQNGVLFTNDHTQLISHTSNGIITSETGVYPDRTGAGAISNSFNYYNSQTELANHYSSSFVYWTDQLTADTSPGADNSYVLINENGQNAPAPWVAYTRAGCDFGAAGIADVDLENNKSDLATVYGAGSPEYNVGSGSTATGTADFEGIALHCAQGSAICAAANTLTTVEGDGLPTSKAVADVLPNEPNGYTGFQGIFGHRYLVPALQSVLGQPTNGMIYDYQGNLIGYQTAQNGQIIQNLTVSGFPGFDGMFPFVTLQYVETMLKAGVPVVYGYFSDAHDHHYGTQDGVNPAGTQFAYGPGEQGYVNQLAQYDAAWNTFFTDLAAAGINQTNTLFVILVEEGDQFAGGAPTPATCDGVNVPCTYPPNQYTGGRPDKGEVDINIDTLLLNETGNSTPFTVHNDQAPAFYLNTNPSQNSTLTRAFEQNLLTLKYQNPYYNDRSRLVENQMADQAEMSVLHQITADPLRTPTLVAFNDPDVYSGIGAVTSGYSNPSCNGADVCTYAGYAWNHGSTAAVVRQTWSSLVGPGVNAVGQDATTWADHTDTRATMFALLGLQDDYLHDGRVLVEDLNPANVPPAISGNQAAYLQLSAAYKQLNAPFGEAGLASLKYATASIGSTSENDGIYTTYQNNINQWVASRNALVAQIRTLLNNAEHNVGFSAADARSLTQQANALIKQMKSWAKQS